MSIARNDFFTRVEYLNSTVSLPVLINTSVGGSGSARILRNGLGILCFNILEDFVRKRTVEVLTEIASSGIEFSKLPKGLQEASTIEAMKSILFQVQLEKKDGTNNWKSTLQDEAFKVYSTKNNTTFSISKYSLAHQSSNVSSKDITDICSRLNISGGWVTLTDMGKCFSSILDMCQAFNNAAERRHAAAHDASFDYEYGYLETFIKKELIPIAASIDILLTNQVRYVIKHKNFCAFDRNNINFIKLIHGSCYARC